MIAEKRKLFYVLSPNTVAMMRLVPCMCHSWAAWCDTDYIDAERCSRSVRFPSCDCCSSRHSVCTHVVRRLCTVFTFARPAVSQDLGEDMAHWQQQVLKRLAAPDSDDTLVSQLLAADS
jgi:hypothetical protein